MACFADIIGHEGAVRSLAESLRLGRSSHAYLFCGRKGVGRKTLAMAFASALLCEQGNACGECKSCKLLKAGNHPDLVMLQPNDSGLVNVEAMRDFCKQISIRPAHASRRIGILPAAEAMNDAASNCFLKTLEEPPGSAMLLLVAESTDQLLRTIVSRCQVVRLGILPRELIEQELVKRGVDKAPLLAGLSGGSLGRALELVQGKEAEDWAWLSRSLPAVSPANALAFANELVERATGDAGEGDRTPAVLGLAALWLRRALRQGEAGSSGGRIRRALAGLEAVLRAEEQLEANVKPELALRSLSLALAGIRPGK